MSSLDLTPPPKKKLVRSKVSLGDREEKLWGPEKSLEMPKEIMEALKECTHGNYLIAFGTGVAQSKKIRPFWSLTKK